MSWFQPYFEPPLVTELEKALRRFRLTPDRRHDILQDTICHLLEKKTAAPDRPLPFLVKAVINRAIANSRRREQLSLEALAAGATRDSEDGSELPVGRDRRPGAPRPSDREHGRVQQVRRQRLISDLLSDYVEHTERYKMAVQREVFERSVQGQAPSAIMVEMRLSPDRVYDHRSNAFIWIQRRAAELDGSGSILQSAFGGRIPVGPPEPRDLLDDRPSPAVRDATAPAHSGPDDERPLVPAPHAVGELLTSLSDIVRWSIDTGAALCPSVEQITALACTQPSTWPRYLHYHILDKLCHLQSGVQTPGCALCQTRLEAAR